MVETICSPPFCSESVADFCQIINYILRNYYSVQSAAFFTQRAFEWKPGLRRDVDEIDDRLCQSMSLDVFVFIRNSLRRCCYRHLADDQASSSSDKTFCDNCRLHHRRYQLLYAYSHVKRGA